MIEDDGSISEVVPGRVWLSGRPADHDEVDRLGINAVVSVGGPQPWIAEWMHDADQPRARSTRLRAYLQAPLIDAPHQIDVPTTDAVIAFALALLTDPGRRLLIHCDGGAFRSVHVAACVLARLEGIPGPEAVRRIDRLRGLEPYRDSIGHPGWHEHLLELAPGPRLPGDPNTPDTPR